MTEVLDMLNPGLVSGLVVGALWFFAIWFAVTLVLADRADKEE